LSIEEIQSKANEVNNTQSSADIKWVNDLYQKYFDRTATQAELDNWTKANPQALEQFLAAEQKKYGYTSKSQDENYQKNLDAAYKIIDDAVANGSIPPDVAALWKEVARTYPKGAEFDTTKILNSFNDIKSKTIDPYYKELADIAMKDVKDSFAVLNASREREVEAQNATAGQNIRQAKAGLESAGMTFSGQGVQQLGAQSAYSQSGTKTTPGQIPFGGLFHEGTVNQANRLMMDDSAARYNAAIQDLGRAAENQLGSEAMKASGIPYTSAGVNLTGSIKTSKQEKLGGTLSKIIEQYRKKQASLVNKDLLK